MNKLPGFFLIETSISRIWFALDQIASIETAGDNGKPIGWALEDGAFIQLKDRPGPGGICLDKEQWEQLKRKLLEE